jgi:hypothetical protein
MERVVSDDGYTNWARWIDSQVDRVPTPCTVALCVAVYVLALLTI